MWGTGSGYSEVSAIASFSQVKRVSKQIKRTTSAPEDPLNTSGVPTTSGASGSANGSSAATASSHGTASDDFVLNQLCAGAVHSVVEHDALVAAGSGRDHVILQQEAKKVNWGDRDRVIRHALCARVCVLDWTTRGCGIGPCSSGRCTTYTTGCSSA